MSRAAVIATVVVVLTAGPVEPASTTGESGVVRVDVVVTDVKSKPVANLQLADFELVDAGEVRSLDSARLHAGAQRIVGIFFDEYHLTAGDHTTRARAALTRLVNGMLRDGDTVAIMKPLDPLIGITLTQDRGAVVEAISKFDGRRGDYASRSKFEEEFISRDPRTADGVRAQVVTSALQALAAKLGDATADRRALIVVSEGFASATARAIAHAANRHNVAIYIVDPNSQTEETEGTLQMLAEQTGGVAFLNQADLVPALSRVVADLDSYYVLEYKTPAPDGKFHPLQVRVKRTGAHTRTRAGYWAANPAPPAAARGASAARGTLPFRPSHSSPYIRPWIGMSRGPSGTTSVIITWEPGAVPPRNQRVASVVVKATNPDGETLFEERIGPGDVERASFNAPPGLMALEMTIQSSSGARLDTDYRGVSVPNLQVTRPTFATPQVLRTRTARNFAEASANADALPVASRTFSRAERLLVRIPVYGPGDSVPDVTATLLNRRGLPMRTLERVPADLPAGLVQFDLPLSSLAPDEYRVELVAANQAGPRDETREIVVFRITN